MLTNRTSEVEPRLRTARLCVVAACGVAAICIATSIGWVGTTFPGFFVMNNRVVPSVGLAQWSGTGDDPIYQRYVQTLDGRAVQSAAEIYRTVASAPPGRPFAYGLQTRTGIEVRPIASMTFGWRDFALMFGPLILNGLVFCGVALLVWVFGARSAATLGTTLFTLDVGLFCLTALDLYGPGNFFRLHVATEALLPVTLMHLCLVFPVVRLGSHREIVLRTLYGTALALLGVYESVLYTPTAYTFVHNTCMAAVGVAGVAMVASCVHGYVTSTSPLVRRRLAVLAFGIVCGFALPTWVMLASAFEGGARALNLAVFTAFLFPLALAYAVVKHDLFEIDAMLRRGVSHVVLTSIVVASYAALALASGLVLRRFDLQRSPLFPLAFTALMILFFQPLRERTQRLVDRLYARSHYDARTTLAQASAELVATLNLDDICRLVLATVTRTFLIPTGSVWLRAGEYFVVAESRGVGWLNLPAGHALIQRLRRAARGISLHDFTDQPESDPAARTCVRVLRLLEADLVLPIGAGDLLGFIALGPKPSRAIFTLEDIAFLTTFLNQVAVAVRNAQAYRHIEELNESLERKVVDRTSELASANQRLADSVEQLETAYDDLKRSQEDLMRAERMATLGQLAAGIAHEVNTPLGAALNSLKITRGLAGEYALSIGDATVDDDDHRAIAAELQNQLRDIEHWAGTAAAFVRTIKNHTHGGTDGHEGLFDVRTLLQDVQLLLAHRLRLSSCVLALDCPESLTLHGDAGKLGQVLTNLVANAIDAYDEEGDAGGEVRIRVTTDQEGVCLAVEDSGCGIPSDQMERIFDALFTTKARGRGTGLGLSLCREIVEHRFGGIITVTSTLGVGTRFLVTLPHRVADARSPGASATAA
jgi:signal transduction histidine kinase